MKRVFTLVAIVAANLAVACAAPSGGPGQSGAYALVVSNTFPSHVDVNVMPGPSPAETQTIAFTVTLTNTSSHDVQFSVGACGTTWTLLDASRHVVDEKLPPKICPMLLRLVTIAPGKALTENAEVVLAKAKLQDNGAYLLRYHALNHQTEAPFTVTLAQ